jgi:hypothetical protein
MLAQVFGFYVVAMIFAHYYIIVLQNQPGAAALYMKPFVNYDKLCEIYANKGSPSARSSRLRRVRERVRPLGSFVHSLSLKMLFPGVRFMLMT